MTNSDEVGLTSESHNHDPKVRSPILKLDEFIFKKTYGLISVFRM